MIGGVGGECEVDLWGLESQIVIECYALEEWKQYCRSYLCRSKLLFDRFTCTWSKLGCIHSPCIWSLDMCLGTSANRYVLTTEDSY